MSHRIIDRRGLDRPSGTRNLKPGTRNPGLGESAYGQGLYATPRNSGESDFYRPRPFGASNLRSALDGADWVEILQYSRQLAAQLPHLLYCIRQKADYSVGDSWIPQYQGNNVAWGEAAEEWLHHIWLPQCDLRGSIWDWQTNLRVTAMAGEIDGDDLVLFVNDENGFPRLKYICADQISSGYESEVKGGPFGGARLCNGIILDRNNRMLGVRIMSSDYEAGRFAQRAPSSREALYQDIPANNCDLSFDPVWSVQSRAIPPIGGAILDWFDVQDIDKFLKRSVKLESSIGLMHFNEAGEAPTGSDILAGRGSSDTDTSPEANDIKIEKRLGGEMLYMRANRGEKLEALNSGRPHPNTEAFIMRLERRGLLAVGWPYELLDPSRIGGASVRLIQDEARATVARKQFVLLRRARRQLHFALAQAMQTGRLPRNEDASGMDWMQWAFSFPGLLTVDAGYEEQADRDNLLLGTTNMAIVCQKKGRWWEKVRAQNVKENRNLIDGAVELVAHASAAGQTLTFREALDLLKRPPQPRQQPAAGEGQNQNSTGGNGGNGGQ